MAKDEILLIIGPNASGKTRLIRKFREIAAPGVLLFDEPFARLDLSHRISKSTEMAKAAKAGKVVIVATKDEDAPAFFPDIVGLNVVRLRGTGGM